MKTLLLAALLTTTAFGASTFAHEGHEEGFQDLFQDTEEAQIYDSVNELMSTKAPKLMTKNFFQAEPFLGLPMRYPTYPHPAADNNIGIATSHNGMPVVLFGPNTANRLGPVIMGFFMQHEYAHHDLRHNPNMSINSATREAQADCRAAQTLKGYGMAHIIPQVAQWFYAQGCHYDPSTNTMNVTDSHPCGVQRAQILQQCAQ